MGRGWQAAAGSQAGRYWSSKDDEGLHGVLSSAAHPLGTCTVLRSPFETITFDVSAVIRGCRPYIELRAGDHEHFP